MSTWLSETEFRQSGAESLGVTINVAFLQEIKEDFGFRNLLNVVYHKLYPAQTQNKVSIREASELLTDLRDELQTYFALEEFYGYFGNAEIDNPCVSQEASKVQSEHVKLFSHLSEIVEWSEQIVYRETGSEKTSEDIALEFEKFCISLAHHEQSEMSLMMRLCNEEFGVGD